MITIFNKINELPYEIINLIKEYIPNKNIVFVNKNFYLSYHNLIKISIINFENYIRDMIRRDNEFIFNMILRENYNKWCEIKQYRYKNIIFLNYIYFIIYYCIEYDSNNCSSVINIFFKEHGLGKNLHKKNVVKYIRWKD
jgi:hypothetical protein